MAGRPGAGGDDQPAGVHATLWRAHGHRASALGGDERRALVNAHAALEQHATQLASQPRRLHRGRIRRVHAAEEAGRVGDGAGPSRVDRLQTVAEAVSSEQIQRVAVWSRLPLGGLCVDHAGVAEGDVGLVPLAPGAHLADLIG